MKKVLISAALAASALGGFAAFAQTPPPQMAPGGMPGMRGMMREDTDGDGRITRAEATAAADARFARMDANGDGQVCGDEMGRRRMMAPPASADGAAPPPPPATKSSKGDMDGDGCLNRDEFRARALKRFDRLDANHDGVIDATERQAMQDRMQQMRDRRMNPPGDVQPSLPAAPPPPEGKEAQQYPGQ